MTRSLKGVLEPCALTPTQEQLWDKTRCALLWHSPAFTHIFYTMLDNANSKHIALFTKNPQIPIAATDGYNMILNPDGFFKYNLQQRVFILAHEIMHNILDHCGQGYRMQAAGKIKFPDGKELEYDHETSNVAMDLVINAILTESKVGEFPPEGCLDTNIATGKDSWVDTYRKIWKKKPPGGGKGREGVQGSGGKGGFDVHLDPGTSKGKDPQSAANERSKAKWDTAVAAAVAAAKAQGKLPAGLERVLGEVLEPKVDWRERIQALFARRLGCGTYDWRKPDRRLISRPHEPIYAPSRSGFGAGVVVVGADTSGSVGDKELDMFFAEISGILEDVKPRELLIMWCDADVHRVDFVDEPGDLNVLRAKGPPGGGGTSFIPVFEKIASMQLEPDALVYLTDGMGSFPSQAPSYPVIWGNITPNYKYPFGDVVDVPKQA